MQAEVAKRLIDALGAARRIQAFTAGQTFADFSSNELVRSAVERQFGIVGEALGKAMAVDPSLELRNPELRKIVGLRNRLIHGYDSVDDEIVWDIVQSKLLPLSADLELLLSQGGFGEGPEA
jgi:uncharacterized protein with HEPN domain